MRLGPAPLAVLVAATAVHCAPDAVLVEDPPPGAGGVGGGSGGGGMGTGACNLSSNVPIRECDLVAQDCPPPQRCAIATNANEQWFTHCIDPNGGKTAGEPCSDQSECEYGLSCLIGHCSPVCCFETDYPCGDAGVCLGRTVYNGGEYFSLRCVYPPPCVLLSPDACVGAMPPGDCHLLPYHARSGCIPPSPNGVSAEGEPCGAINQCGEAQVCFPLVDDGSNVCRYNCFLDGSGSPTPGLGGCPPGRTCTDQGLDQPNIGVCMP